MKGDMKKLQELMELVVKWNKKSDCFPESWKIKQHEIINIPVSNPFRTESQSGSKEYKSEETQSLIQNEDMEESKSLIRFNDIDDSGDLYLTIKEIDTGVSKQPLSYSNDSSIEQISNHKSLRDQYLLVVGDLKLLKLIMKFTTIWFCVTFGYYGITLWLDLYLKSKNISYITTPQALLLMGN